MSDCPHPSILRFVGDNVPSMWGCASCSHRFYPACDICVSVGHRREHEAPDTRLREAAQAVVEHRAGRHGVVAFSCGLRLDDHIADLRAALATGDEP